MSGGCIVPGCPAGRASWLGVCAGHWDRLPAGLREAWWEAWHADARVAAWTAARGDAVKHLTDDGP